MHRVIGRTLNVDSESKIDLHICHLREYDPDVGVMNWEIEIDIYTLICIKWITNKNLLYKKINKQTKQLILNFLWVICMEIC